MKLSFLLALLLCLPQIPSRREAIDRPAPLERSPLLFMQNDPPTAQGLWFNGWMVGVIGWEGSSVPAGAQVSLKGHGFLGHGVMLVMRYSYFSDDAEVMYIIPRVSHDFLPVDVDSIGFFLPPIVHGPVEIFCWVDGKATNEVGFKVQ